MRPNHSDMRMYADLSDLNRGFLGLLTEPGAQQAVPNFGLDAAIIDQLCRLSLAELEFIAGTPGLLACFSQLPTVSMHRVAEAPTTRQPAQAAWRESARLYVTGLLTYYGRWNNVTGLVARSVPDLPSYTQGRWGNLILPGFMHRLILQ